jgi:glyoxylase-like metal-dependent hydrolase (beta-lactamase superfamily II)
MLKIIGYALAAACLFLLVILGKAHWQIRQFDAPLPADSEVLSILTAADRPSEIQVINTATQNIPGIGLLAYPAFVLRWPDGRLLIVDTGMTRAGAAKFGAFLERVAGADAIDVYGSVGEQLGSDLQKVGAVILTHLHDDHIGGFESLCTDVRPTTVYRTIAQAEHANYTTRNGFKFLRDSSCVRSETLSSGTGLVGVPNFPGVAVYAAGGHTPGSTIVFATVGEEIWVLSGDISNDKNSITKNISKPFLYSLLVTPEDVDRMQELRVWLAGLDAQSHIHVLVSHDRNAIAASGLSIR